METSASGSLQPCVRRAAGRRTLQRDAPRPDPHARPPGGGRVKGAAQRESRRRPLRWPPPGGVRAKGGPSQATRASHLSYAAGRLDAPEHGGTLSPPGELPMIVIEWMVDGSRGLMDMFSPSDFRDEATSGVQQVRRSLRGEVVVEAGYDLHTVGTTATLTYSADDAGAIVPGSYDFTFSDQSRTELEKAVWNQEGGIRLDSREGHLKITNGADREYIEGSASLRLHLSRDRDVRLRQNKLRDDPTPICSVCGHDAQATYGGLQSIELHHIDAIRQGKRISTEERTAWLCANCHRAIHALRGATVH